MSVVLAPQPGGGMPPDWRKRLTVIALVLAFVLVLGGGAAFNWVVYTEHGELKQLMAGYELELSRLEQIRADIRAEDARRDELQAGSDVYYAQLPDMAAVPDIVGQLEQIAAAVGGDVIDVQYVEPAWDGHIGVARLQFAIVGSFDAIVTYLESATVTVPTMYWESFDIQPVDDEGRDLLLFANVRLDLFRDRADWAAPWQAERTRLVDRTAAVNPFGAPLSSITIDEEPTTEDAAP